MCFVTYREGGLSRREQLVGYFYTWPLKAWPTVWLIQRQPTSACSALALTDAYAASARGPATSVSFGSRQCG